MWEYYKKIRIGRIFLVFFFFSIRSAERSWKVRLKRIFCNNLQVPEEWRRFFYNWEPQIWYFLQQYAWVRRSEEHTKQVAIKFALTSPVTADMRIKTPNAIAERTDLALPWRIERFPSSLQEIKRSLYGKTFAGIDLSMSCGNCSKLYKEHMKSH